MDRAQSSSAEHRAAVPASRDQSARISDAALGHVTRNLRMCQQPMAPSQIELRRLQHRSGSYFTRATV
jgi:hypothetical protein